MGLPRSDDSTARFLAYVEGLKSVIGHVDRAKPLRDYCLGLIMPCERKSVEPMAAMTAPERTAAQHQSVLHFIGEGRCRMRRSSPRCGNWCCRRWSATG
jgi:SRSO17 transposase